MLCKSAPVYSHKTLGLTLILAKIRYNTGSLPRLFPTLQLQFVIYFSLFLLRWSCFSMLLRSHYNQLVCGIKLIERNKANTWTIYNIDFCCHFESSLQKAFQLYCSIILFSTNYTVCHKDFQFEYLIRRDTACDLSVPLIFGVVYRSPCEATLFLRM